MASCCSPIIQRPSGSGDLAGGGRLGWMGTPLGSRALARYVSVLQQQGIAFNYPLNSSCQANREWTRTWQRSFRLVEVPHQLHEPFPQCFPAHPERSL